ncbi:hypothetical protein BDZ89DRAFT_975877 [Hymenopellis radicata]|nr:hypothetical protein BDZ89DRAFT_975877 [Hymenopellis radicata]
MAPRRRCPICRSRQWHKEPSSGLIACSEGHILQDYRNETVEAEAMGAHAVHKRTLKSGRKKKVDESGIGRANPELYHGPRGTFLYYQCLQLILRKQIAALIRLWELPQEFELVCKDLWALNLTLLPEHPPPEPYYYVHGESIDTVNAAKDEDGEKFSAPENSEDAEDDPIVAALEADTSSDEEEASSDTSDPPNVDRRKRSPDLNKYRSLASTIAVLALACWMLRIPIMYSDLISAIEAYELPYLDSAKFIPSSMVVHLTKQTIQSLSMQRPPKLFALHALTSRLAKKVNLSYNISTPELNAAPLLWRVTRALGGTPILYQMTKQLSRILDLPLSVNYTLAPSLERTKGSDPDYHTYDHVPAELGFVAGTIVVLKMVYGLDGVERIPADPGDPAVGLPRIDEFLDSVAAMEKHEAKRMEELFRPETQVTVGDLSDSIIDEYVRLCEQALLGDVEEKNSVVGKYFPLRKGEWDRKQPEVSIRGPLHATGVDEKPNTRPGEKHKIFIGADNGGSVSPDLNMLVRRGARLVRAGEEDVFRVMERYERSILEWWKSHKRGGARTRGSSNQTPTISSTL